MHIDTLHDRIGHDPDLREQVEAPRRSGCQDEALAHGWPPWVCNMLGVRVPAIIGGRPGVITRLLEAERDAPLGQVVGRHFHVHLVAGENANAVLAHLAGGVREDFVPVVELHAEHRVGQDFGHGAGKFEQVFFGHTHRHVVDTDPRDATGWGKQPENSQQFKRFRGFSQPDGRQANRSRDGKRALIRSKSASRVSR